MRRRHRRPASGRGRTQRAGSRHRVRGSRRASQNRCPDRSGFEKRGPRAAVSVTARRWFRWFSFSCGLGPVKTNGQRRNHRPRRSGCRSPDKPDRTHDFRSDHDRLFHPGHQDRAAPRFRPGGGQEGVRRPARRAAAGRRVLLRRLRGRGPAHRAGAGRWTAGHDLTGGLLARAGHRGEARRGDRRGATVQEPAHDVGGGRLVATVTDPDGNVLGLLQDR